MPEPMSPQPRTPTFLIAMPGLLPVLPHRGALLDEGLEALARVRELERVVPVDEPHALERAVEVLRGDRFAHRQPRDSEGGPRPLREPLERRAALLLEALVGERALDES